MRGPIIVVDSSEIRPGRLEDLKVAIHRMTEFVERNVPDALTYNVYLNRTGTRMTVVQMHPDSKSMELHMDVSAPIFRGFVDLIRLSTMDVYGVPSEELVERLRTKVRLLGGATMTMHEFEAGFTRLRREPAAAS